MRKLLAVALICLAYVSLARAGDDPLVAGFQNPPDSAKPHTWWHWMNGNISKEGITADLEAMKRVGVGGAEIFVADCDIPAGSVSFMSAPFRDMMKHAATEADRLGLELCMHNCAGWSSSGGPWNTPEHAMQFVTTSEVKVHGPTKFDEQLPQPPMKNDFYRDITVLAFRTPAGESESLQAKHPTITASVDDFDGAKIIDGDVKTEASLPRPAPGKPQFVQFVFDQPINVRSITITPGAGEPDSGGAIEISDDGQNFRALRDFSVPRHALKPALISLGDTPISARGFRIRYNRAGNAVKNIALAEIDFDASPVIENVQAKAGFIEGHFDSQSEDTSTEHTIHSKDLVDLTSKLSSDGKLSWDVPEGDWTILRVGYTPTGVTNHPAPPEGTGLECDKFSKEALDAHWAGYVQKILDDIGPLAGKSLKDCLIDSYEVRGQNWTPKMIEEFQKRRGYDPTRFLPVITGRVVDSTQASERFLWDLRRTIADLFAENYYGHFAELCHAHGLIASIEPYTGPFESLQSGAPADIVMGEFWTGSDGHGSIKLASSVAHIYGKQIVGAESFTAKPPEHGRWQEDPYTIKALGDLMYTRGINRFIFHRYAHQPWMDKFPGMTMGPWGFHFDRTNTWFEKSTSWLKYVARCQYLLQSGRFYADAAYFCGESAPVETKSGDPILPVGFDYDNINADVLLNRATVKDGRITLPDGMSYAVLVLPPKQNLMTPVLLTKIRDLVKDGATIVGPKITRSPSLQDYPKCDDDVRTLAEEVWGNCDGTNVTEHACGKGKAVWGKTLGEVFESASLKPDFEVPAESLAKLVYIHRVVGDDDVYFVSNQRDGYSGAKCIFRVTGKTPQLWHPDSGMMETAPVFSEAGGRTTVQLQFEPSGSVFVLFRKSASPANHITELASADAKQPTLPKIAIASAVYQAVDGTGSLDVTNELRTMAQSSIERIMVSNATFGQDPAINHSKQLRVEYSIDGKSKKKTVNENETFELVTMSGSQEPPAYELRASADGAVELLAWGAGTYDVKRADGKTDRVQVKDVASPIEVAGPWELHFPPKWGAPEKISLDKLASWTEHSDPGVKYFSGTATYIKEIDISSEMLSANRSLYLDLGRVKNLAQVKLNGKDLGILWKPPFRVDLTGLATAGKNSLEISITNLWPNRLIGDEKIGLDADWAGTHLARWPQWLLDGKPSPSGRLTFTTWHHWTADMQPLESGLLGPVKLEAVERVKLQ